ncbi:IS66 family insertion sequence element accessory protein TnpB [Frigidibacter mobilis]|uniref:Transposase, IS66 Orf2 like protein n=1 Tax=Frigidibacter mobilis TaxID=1335048 RepID=A0A165SVW7_9RHOB|nr:IS66 family insertion sequence element accessory protein TnpB [Frigidibacter mobilis]AMY71693.1 transposase, IS66 Orf2 like protein [Frigidibacter mobilis]
MISPSGDLRVYVATRPVDFRKGIDGLALAVQETLGLDPFSGAAFVFRSKRADRIKVLIWDQTGIVLVHKRLEAAKFVWPRVQPDDPPLPFALILSRPVDRWQETEVCTAFFRAVDAREFEKFFVTETDARVTEQVTQLGDTIISYSLPNHPKIFVTLKFSARGGSKDILASALHLDQPPYP